VFYTYAYLGILFVPMLLLYCGLSSFFRNTSRDLKRIDSTTRSFIYSHFAEQLTGTSSIRAFGQQETFLKKLSKSIDFEFRFHYTSMVAGRWLGLRLDSLGSLLILGVALFGVFFRDNVAPSKFGVVITYAMQSTLMFSQLILCQAVLEQGKSNVAYRNGIVH
jgi:ATP-binding cassette subfamily C (CFTR/MRP) protein 1